MGFFSDTKKTQEEKVIKQEAQWWPVALLIVLLSAIGAVLGWMLKPLLTYLFTFEGRTSRQVRTQILVIALAGLTICALVYQIPFARNLTVSTTHTLNVSKYGGRLQFPEPHYFLPEGQRRGFEFDSKTYITFAGYTKGVMQKMGSGQCQMVTNWHRTGLASLTPPTAAEGFADEVRYTVVQSIESLTGLRYAWERFTRPKHWWRIDGLAQITVEREKTESWRRFIDDWDLVWKFGDGYRAFEVRSLWNEHALICF